jgi:hypothetical protein
MVSGRKQVKEVFRSIVSLIQSWKMFVEKKQRYLKKARINVFF